MKHTSYDDLLRHVNESSEDFLRRVQELDRKRPGTWRWWMKIVGHCIAGSAIGSLLALFFLRLF